MKKLSVIFLLLASFNLIFGQSLKVMSFNIRYDAKHDTVNNWIDRKGDVVNLIKKYSPDILGVQEALSYQVDFLDSSLSSYKFIGCGRIDGKERGEYSAIFYKSNRFDVAQYMTVWLSESGDTGSVGWDAALPRIATFGKFFDKESKDTLIVLNTHFDHQGEEARENSSSELLGIITSFSLSKYPVVVTGDFNSEEDEEPVTKICKFLNDSRKISVEEPEGTIGTFNGFYDETPSKRIDYVFVKKLKVNKYKTINDKRNSGKFISDHFPVMVEVEYE